MFEYITAEAAIKKFQLLAPDTELCPYCHSVLHETVLKELYCPNEMCLYDPDD